MPLSARKGTILLYYICTIAVLVTYLCFAIYDANEQITLENLRNKRLQLYKTHNVPKLKFILQWILPNIVPFVYMGKGNETFVRRNCTYQNCYVTANRQLLPRITDYHVIAFNGPQVIEIKDFPKRRSLKQKYVFASIESSHYYPACDRRFDGYFNWTWTYKLISDEPYGYIVVRDKHGDVIGPRTDMTWIPAGDMEDIDDVSKAKLGTKTKAAAWIVSNCKAPSKRHEFVKQVRAELQPFNLTVDVYGKCGTLVCPYEHMEQCLDQIEKDYYFYFSLENSFSEDYVTEKLLHALQHSAVPVVFGGANYSRFMPEGIYLNGRELGAKKLARKMKDLIDNPEEYYKYFKWRNHYSYHSRDESPDTDDYCKFCEMMNNQDLMETTSIYHEFRKWWNPPGMC